MFTDTVGYTAATHAGEGRTLEQLRQQAELVRPLVAVHQGREIKSTGDGFLIEFDSALKATQCAVSIQRRLHERNEEEGLAPILIRIGIHLGDVVQSGTDILGDAVNIAGRIEPLAEPGGVCVSGAVHEQVRNKIPNRLEKLPPTELKGLQISIDIYRVVLPWIGPVADTAAANPTGIAVLPFTNISPDLKDEYFADGLTEELISVLSEVRELPVIARTSVMQYKATAKPVSQIGRELGVSTILEGSVRKAGNRLRITAQLVDAASQRHLWSSSYDRELDDIFALQTEIARKVSEALRIELRPAETARLESRTPVRPDSYLAYLKGRTLLHEIVNESSLKSAKEQFELAIRLDVTNASAYSGLSDATFALAWYGRGDVPWAKRIDECRALATHAVELDPGLAEAHVSLGNAHWLDYRFFDAEKEFLRALALNPSYPRGHHWYGILLEELGRPEEALQELRLAEGADPRSLPVIAAIAQLLRWLGRLDEARMEIERLRTIETYPRVVFFQAYEYYVARSDAGRALQELDRARDAHSDDPVLLKCYAEYYAWTGEKDRALEYLRQFEAKAENHPHKEALMADAYTRLNELDEVFRWLDRAFERHYVEIRWWRLDPRSALVRGDPRFLKLLHKMNLR